MLPVSLSRALFGPARTTTILASAMLLLVVLLASAPSLLVLSFNSTGPARVQKLVELITDWTRVLITIDDTTRRPHAPIPTKRRRRRAGGRPRHARS
ncbi:hypothetical protein F7Q99_27855 [Streptomyces kaniharaensis]|uniref:Uncharacterized protein n=1 Tax=Streptomyces kaniharaensis TaxID=212423 RepID=A0A6N7L1B0_9ACTN|nr:hypothetical protein [Streptomyces kaniharaensis]MQS15964.1 hypothetical protein [Streptomyces kaniharaensis]